jgi:lipooligosaccharide transport system permease protein
VFATLGLMYAYWIKRVDYLAYYWTLFITPMFMFAGVFFPLERLPDWVRTIAWFMPLYHAANLMRSLMTQGDPGAALGSALWLAVVVAALILVPSLMLRRRLVG